MILATDRVTVTDFLDAGACLEGVVKFVSKTGKIAGVVAELTGQAKEFFNGGGDDYGDGDGGDYGYGNGGDGHGNGNGYGYGGGDGHGGDGHGHGYGYGNGDGYGDGYGANERML